MGWKNLLIVLMYCTATVSVAQKKKSSSHEVSITSSTFTIYGSTNLNTFECTLVQNVPSNSISVTSQKSEMEIFFTGLTMEYPIKQFDCGLEAMSQDLRNTLKYEQYPNLYLTINSISIKKENQEIEKLKVKSSVTIEIAGVSYQTSVEDGIVINHTENALTLSGTQKLSMSYFNIEPPSKFFGMVKVNSDLSVGFSIDMEVKSTN